jgi:hypothetical protein
MYLEGSSSDQIKVLSQHLHGWSEENKDQPHSEQLNDQGLNWEHAKYNISVLPLYQPVWSVDWCSCTLFMQLYTIHSISWFMSLSVGLLTMLSGHRLYSIEWQDSTWIIKDLDGSSRGLIEVKSWRFPGQTVVHHENLLGQAVSWLRFEPRTSWIWD